MSDQRYEELMASDDAKLTQEEIARGWHFCPDWDCLLINTNDHEPGCSCE